jgi:hypothetical protein
MKMGAVADLPMAWSMHQCTSSTKQCAGRNSSLNVPQQLASPAVWLAVGGLVDAMFSAQAQAPPSNAAIMSIQLGDSLSASRSPGKHQAHIKSITDTTSKRHEPMHLPPLSVPAAAAPHALGHTLGAMCQLLVPRRIRRNAKPGVAQSPNTLSSFKTNPSSSNSPLSLDQQTTFSGGQGSPSS